MGIHWSSKAKALVCMYDMGQCNKYSTTTQKPCSKINHNNNTERTVEIMIDLMPIDLMIQKVGISAYIRLKNQLSIPFQAQGKTATPHLQ